MKMADFVDHNMTTLSRLERGDLVKFHRPGYSHWGVYIGDEKIVHRTGEENDGIDAQINPRYITSSSGTSFDKAKVVVDNFWKVAGSSKADKDNTKDSKLIPLDPEKIERNAQSKIGEVGYNLIFANCEHFAKWCRYGVASSDQVENAIPGVALGLGIASALAVGGAVWAIGKILSKVEDDKEKEVQKPRHFYF